MEQVNLQLIATPVIADFDENGNGSSYGLSGRSTRQVLIPSELVVVDFHAAAGAAGRLQADLVNISRGGCCLVLPRRLELPIGSTGVLYRGASANEAAQQRPFEVRWVQDLGDMMESGLKFVDV
ncbi:MAG: hypothetical protein RLZZ124_1416 [Cyanobacteriota bacterium]|jgi:hypothetical protein